MSYVELGGKLVPCTIVQRYLDGDVRVRVDSRMYVVPATALRVVAK